MLPRSITRCVLLGLSLATGGCSLPLVQGPPPGHRAMDSFSCSESRVLPRLDYAGAFVALGAAAVVSPTRSVSNSAFGTVTTTSGSATNSALGLGAAVLLGVSGWVGGRRAGGCRAAKLELAERIGGTAALAPSAPASVVGARSALVAGLLELYFPTVGYAYAGDLAHIRVLLNRLWEQGVTGANPGATIDGK